MELSISNRYTPSCCVSSITPSFYIGAMGARLDVMIPSAQHCALVPALYTYMLPAITRWSLVRCPPPALPAHESLVQCSSSSEHSLFLPREAPVASRDAHPSSFYLLS